MRNGISYFNTYWQDLKITSFKQMLQIVQQMDHFMQMDPNSKVFVHCHAGMGRTAQVIAVYMCFSGMAKSAEEAIDIVVTQRPGALNNKLSSKKAKDMIRNFDKQVRAERDKIYPDNATLDQVMASQSVMFHGQEYVNYRNCPKVLAICLKYFQSLQAPVSMQVSAENESKVKSEVKPAVKANNWAVDFTEELAAGMVWDFLGSLLPGMPQ